MSPEAAGKESLKKCNKPYPTLLHVDCFTTAGTERCNSTERAVSNFLGEAIFNYNIDTLMEKLLQLENVDFELSQNNKLVVNMKSHGNACSHEE